MPMNRAEAMPIGEGVLRGCAGILHFRYSSAKPIDEPKGWCYNHGRSSKRGGSPPNSEEASAKLKNHSSKKFIGGFET